VSNLWVVAVDWASHSKRIKEMAEEACQHSGLHELGWRHERPDIPDEGPLVGEITDTPTTTHILPLEGGFHARAHPVKDLDGNEYHRITVDDSTDLGQRLYHEIEHHPDGMGSGSRFDEINGIHPDLLPHITNPASIKVHDPRHLPRAFDALMKHPDTMRAMQDTMRARRLSGHDLENAAADFHPHHIQADGTKDTRSPEEHPKWFDQEDQG
jgi:hypothetical protein